MIFYDAPMPAPNPRRVRIFAAEAGIDVPTQSVSIVEGEHKAPDFLAINPRGQLPALQTDEGEVITESVAICRYLDALHGGTSLFGASAIAAARIEMWMRRVEFLLGDPVGKFWVHSHPFTAKLPIEHFPDYGESSRKRALSALAVFDQQLSSAEFLAGKAYSMADILLLSTVDFAAFIGIAMPDALENLHQWRQKVSARPSANA